MKTPKTRKEKHAVRRARAHKAADAAHGGAVEEFAPKPGPGQVFTRERIGKDEGERKRYRNVGESPLALAYHRGQLHAVGESRDRPAAGTISADERHDCGQKFERWWYVKQSSPGRDSSQPGIGGGRETWTERQEQASDQLVRLRGNMAPRNFAIVVAFCGEGYSMIESLRLAGVEAHPIGTAFRIREAMDDLVHAMTGRDVSARVDKSRVSG